MMRWGQRSIIAWFAVALVLSACGSESSAPDDSIPPQQLETPEPTESPDNSVAG